MILLMWYCKYFMNENRRARWHAEPYKIISKISPFSYSPYGTIIAFCTFSFNARLSPDFKGQDAPNNPLFAKASRLFAPDRQKSDGTAWICTYRFYGSLVIAVIYQSSIIVFCPYGLQISHWNPLLAKLGTFSQKCSYWDGLWIIENRNVIVILFQGSFLRAHNNRIKIQS